MLDRGKSAQIGAATALAPLLTDRLAITPDFLLYARIHLENRPATPANARCRHYATATD
jgi:hypothetical protein